MSEFFKGWKRKIGLLTLLMACVFMGGWVRSLTYTEIVDFAKGECTTDIFYSFDGVLVWRKVFQECPDVSTSFQEWESVPSTRFVYHFFMDDRINWIWLWAGAGFGMQVEAPNDCSYFCSIPYWSIVIPLTLLSGWLLISKPRQSQSKTFVEPISETVA